MNELGIVIKDKMANIEGRQIPVPTLELGKKKSVEKGKEAFFNLFAQPIFQAKHNIPCTIIYSKNAAIQPLVDTFNKTFPNLGVSMTISKVELSQFNEKSVTEEMAKAVNEKDARIVCVVLPNNLKNLYKNLKVFSMKLEIPTQMCTEGTLRKKGIQSIATKILLQIIAKRGNVLWSPTPKSSIDLDVMLVGF